MFRENDKDMGYRVWCVVSLHPEEFIFSEWASIDEVYYHLCLYVSYMAAWFRSRASMLMEEKTTTKIALVQLYKKWWIKPNCYLHHHIDGFHKRLYCQGIYVARKVIQNLFSYQEHIHKLIGTVSAFQSMS